MASFWSFFLVIFMVCFSSTTLASQKVVQVQQQNVQFSSSISAAPALLPGPEPPLPSPTLSPDIEPLLPTTPQTPSPSESSSSVIPTIPSSPSPPNPDSILAPGPAGMAISPSGPLPESSTDALSSSSAALYVIASLSVLWLVQLPSCTAGM